MKLEGKVALVTGSNGGISQGIAVHLAPQGADVVPVVAFLASLDVD